MNKLKKFFKFLPVVAIAFFSGLSALLSNGNVSSAYADSNLLLFTDYYASGTLPTTYQFVNENDSSDVLDISFGVGNVSVDYYQNRNGDDIVRYGSFTHNVGLVYIGHTSGTYPFKFSVMNLPLDDFTLKYYLKDFKFIEEVQHSSNPAQSSLWRVSITFDLYINDLFFETIVSYNNNFSCRGSLRNADLSPYICNFSSPYELYYEVSITDELIASNRYQVGYNDGYSVGYDTGYDTGYSAGEYDGRQTGYQIGRDAGYADGVASQQSNISNAYSEGVETGYNQGFEAGASSRDEDVVNSYNNGYSAGYEDGFNVDSTVASIFSGILQVGMLPVNVLLVIFNFEILGINLSAFISAILTVCLTVIVIRTIKGGGSSD